MCPRSDAIQITWRLAKNLPPVECSPDQLVLVFLNLLDNALRSAKSRVIFETAQGNGVVIVKVSDDGPGVPAVSRDRIFDPFFTTRKEEGGTGLGLCLSRTVIQEHHGQLSLDESVSQGACFVVELPVRSSAQAAVGKKKRAQASRQTGGRVLIVEDEPDQLFMLTMALQSRGHEVDTASTGAQALDLMNSNRYDAAVIDFVLPDELGGRELYQILLRTNPELADRVIFITGDTMKYGTRKFFQEVKRPHLKKPFLIADFTSQVEKIVHVLQ